ncbi:hypothetical protein [Neisseria sp.]|uniref:hypothetical protein n=1 Tax=Neisseria sp. TaxID=192066 RepID=UPI0035A01A34
MGYRLRATPSETLRSDGVLLYGIRLTVNRLSKHKKGRLKIFRRPFYSLLGSVLYFFIADVSAFTL